MKTLLVAAAEKRELAGILGRAGSVRRLNWPVAFACETISNGTRMILAANGPGPRLAGQLMQAARREAMDAVISTGCCGALDPALGIGDIVVATEVRTPERSYGALLPRTGKPFARGSVISQDRVAVTVAEKQNLRALGGIGVEMEAAAVAAAASEWGVEFYCIRSVSDIAGENFAIDFNRVRDNEGRFLLVRIVGAAMARPWDRIPALLRLDASSRRAAEALGEFLGDCSF